MTAEEKVLSKFKSIMIADTTLNNYFEKRIYVSHISTIGNAAFPACSLHILSSSVDFAARNYVTISLQIDVWFPFDLYNATEIYSCVERIRDLFDRQNLSDTTLSLKVGRCAEISSAPIMVEEDTRLTHYAQLYQIIAA